MDNRRWYSAGGLYRLHPGRRQRECEVIKLVKAFTDSVVPLDQLFASPHVTSHEQLLLQAIKDIDPKNTLNSIELSSTILRQL
ncbi:MULTISPECIES: hypothetical protein [unclassified Pseudomonas]|uniref:hypothetical protein n=1 Tax=unclassified Pseudomonas TaxID=196821 RepID=UPI002AC99A5D|nr:MULTISPECIES: hypothetical protein [unclassified Pseudomonas]MEB0039281.1 hypothetical protein [Pseudomonas sp. MH10]MEB0119720.1 hypothetical protein [Pseudomonas sp. CCI1.2]WPX64888.1 hypothetical protein RHM59_04120 [Pseudomonas sp. MH10]